MGIIRAAAHAVGGGLADQWLEVIEPENMGEQTVFSAGVQIRRGEKRKRVIIQCRIHPCRPCLTDSSAMR